MKNECQSVQEYIFIITIVNIKHIVHINIIPNK